jgi:hypothetical protein
MSPEVDEVLTIAACTTSKGKLIRAAFERTSRQRR